MLTYRKYISHVIIKIIPKVSRISLFIVTASSTAPMRIASKIRIDAKNDSLVQKNTAYHASDKIYIAITRAVAVSVLFFPFPAHESVFSMIATAEPISA